MIPRLGAHFLDRLQTGGFDRFFAAVEKLPVNPLADRITAYGTHEDTTHHADCILVLGCGVNADGTLSDALKARVQNAEQLFRAGRAPYVLFSGGPEPNGQVEAHAMRQQAIQDGLPADRLLVEDRSRTTWQNFEFSRAIMDANHWQTCLISTAPFHERRAMSMAHAAGMTAFPTPTHLGSEANDPATIQRMTARECVATVAWDATRILTGGCVRP